MGKGLKIGSRESVLAIAQSKIVIDIIKENCPEYDIELITMKTTGDKTLDKPLYNAGGKGLFVKELDLALLSGKVDLTVHSLKDMPIDTDERIPIAAFTKRESPYDALILPKGVSFIDFSKPIGSSSIRRIIQLKKLYPQAVFKQVRGNVPTRLDKLDKGEYSALILAEAGLIRLSLSERINRVFSEKEIIPAPGQGIIAVQKRKDDKFEFLKYINDADSEVCAKAERAFLKRLGGGCSYPAAAFARVKDSEIEITGFYGYGKAAKTEKIKGHYKDGEKLGAKLGEKFKGEILP